MGTIYERPEVFRSSDGKMWETTRSAEEYGDVKLSVQASRTHYCSPRVDGLNLSDYDEVEVALIPAGEHEEFLTPTDIGLPDLEEHWEEKSESFVYPVGAWVPQEALDRIRETLKRRDDE